MVEGWRYCSAKWRRAGRMEVWLCRGAGGWTCVSAASGGIGSVDLLEVRICGKVTDPVLVVTTDKVPSVTSH